MRRFLILAALTALFFTPTIPGLTQACLPLLALAALSTLGTISGGALGGGATLATLGSSIAAGGLSGALGIGAGAGSAIAGATGGGIGALAPTTGVLGALTPAVGGLSTGIGTGGGALLTSAGVTGSTALGSGGMLAGATAGATAPSLLSTIAAATLGSTPEAVAANLGTYGGIASGIASDVEAKAAAKQDFRARRNKARIEGDALTTRDIQERESASQALVETRLAEAREKGKIQNAGLSSKQTGQLSAEVARRATANIQSTQGTLSNQQAQSGIQRNAINFNKGNKPTGGTSIDFGSIIARSLSS